MVDELVGLKELCNERDRRYTERFESIEQANSAALLALAKQTELLSQSNQKAVDTALANQKDYNVSHNDLTKKMDTQYKEMVSRGEYTTAHAALVERLDEKASTISERIVSIEKQLAQSTGRSMAGSTQIMTVVLILGLLINMGLGLMTFLALIAHITGLF